MADIIVEYDDHCGDDLKVVSGFGGFYSISQNGDVFSNRGRVKPFIKRGGYLEVYLRARGSKKHCFLHRLVYESWVGPIPKGFEINHIDGDKANNLIDNLEAVTPSENSTHSCRVLKRGTCEKHPNRKLSLEDVRAIRKLLDNGKTYLSISQVYGVKPAAIYKIKTGRTWFNVQ